MTEAHLRRAVAPVRPAWWRVALALLRHAAVGCACIFLLADA